MRGFRGILALLAVIAPLPAVAAELTWPDGSIFAEPPRPAKARPGSPCEVAERYVRLVAADRAPEVVEMFADDAALFSSQPEYLKGRAAITGFYAKVHNPGAIPVGFIETGLECAVTIAGLLASKEPGGPRRYGLVAMDHFILNPAGKIRHLIIYVRPDARERLPR